MGTESSPVGTDAVPRRTVSEMSGIVEHPAAVREILGVTWGPAPHPPTHTLYSCSDPFRGNSGEQEERQLWIPD